MYWRILDGWMSLVLLSEVLRWMLGVGFNMDFDLDVQNDSIGGSGMDVGSGP